MANFDKKIEQTLASLDGFEQADIPPDLEQKIRQRIDNQEIKSVRIVPFRIVLLAAAVFFGIVFLNVASLVLDKISNNSGVGEQGQKTNVKAFTSAYFNDSSLNY